MEKFLDVSNTKDNEQKEVLQTPSLETLQTLTFNESTKWSDELEPKKMIEHGKTPPLGIKKLHQMGVTGEGVTVAIIDKPLALDHPEYKGKILSYKNFCQDSEISSMHGPAVTSLLVGENLGVAFKAKVIYAAIPFNKRDARYSIKALDWILEINKTLPDKEKIKFVSISAAQGNKDLFKYSQLWNKKVEQVQAQGICVVECSEVNRFITAGYVDYDTKEFKYGYPNMPMRNMQIGQVHVPNSLRTVAESYDNKHFSYAYYGVGGLSWGIPYAVGVLCLGQQVNPKLTAFELKSLLIETAAQNKCIIDPISYIEKVKQISKCKNIKH